MVLKRRLEYRRICRVCKDEKDVRIVLDEIWQKPLKAEKVLDETSSGNRSVFEFEKVLSRHTGYPD